MGVCLLLLTHPPNVGVTRLELATTRPPDVYANQLRYIPIPFSFIEIDCKDTSFFQYGKTNAHFFSEKRTDAQPTMTKTACTAK